MRGNARPLALTPEAALARADALETIPKGDTSLPEYKASVKPAGMRE